MGSFPFISSQIQLVYTQTNLDRWCYFTLNFDNKHTVSTCTVYRTLFLSYITIYHTITESTVNTDFFQNVALSESLIFTYDHNIYFVHGRQNVDNAYRQVFLEHENPMCYIVSRKRNNRPQSGWPHEVNSNIEITTFSLSQSFGVVFLCLKHYLINVKTNVSNARMNIPKAIRSLKSKWFLLSISTTPILCRIEVIHPATRLFLSIYYHKDRQRTIFISISFDTLFISFK